MKKSILIFRHFSTEGPGYFTEFLDRHKLPHRTICIDASDPVPDSIADASGLVFMGGPMSVNVAFTNKAVSGLGNLIGGVLLDGSGFPRGAEVASVAAVPESKVLLLGLLQGPGMVLFYLGSLFFLARYRISRGRYAVIRAALPARGAATPHPHT